MLSETKTLTERRSRPLAVQILLYSLPLMLSNVLQVLFHMADVAVVGRFSGPIALGAVGSCAVAVTLFGGFLIGTSGGVNSLVARYFGAKNDRELGRTVHSSLIIMLAIGVIFLFFGLFGSRALLELLGTKDDLIDKAVDYMSIYFIGMPALAIYNFGNAVFSAIGNTKKPLLFLSVSGVLNVILNLVFVIGFNLDVVGVALASAISQYLSAILVMISLFGTKEIYGVKLSEIRLTAKNTREILSIGLPSGFQHAIFYVANLFVQFGVNTFDTVTVAGNSAAINSDGLVFDVMAAFYTACSSFTGQCYGAGEKEQIRKIYLITLAYSFAVGTILGGSLVLLGPQFLSIFTDDPAVVEAGMTRLTIMGLCYGFSAFMDNPIAALRGIGKSVLSAIFVIIGSCIFRIIWMFTVFEYFRTIESIYLLYIFSWTLTAILENIYFVISYKRLMRSDGTKLP